MAVWRKKRGYYSLVLLAVACILFSGCSLPFGAGPKPQIKVIPEPPGQDVLGFQDALDQYRVQQQAGGQASHYDLHFIRGNGITVRGEATSWIFGVSEAGQNYHLVFSTTKGPQKILWKGTMPAGTVSPESVILPQELFERRSALIRGLIDDTHVKKDGAADTLELLGNTYVLRVKNDRDLTTLTFDATTGELVP